MTFLDADGEERRRQVALEPPLAYLHPRRRIRIDSRTRELGRHDAPLGLA